ncbi:MAG: TPM domain-containing protein, partial [Burkholderiaceae bacterium]
MALWRLLTALALAAWLTAAGAQDFVPVPPLSAHVIDQIGMLDARQRTTLDGVLTEYEQKTGSQIVLLLMSSTAPEAIEQYSIRVADAWRLGRKGIDDGVILVVARDNPSSLRRLRIEAGRGVQGSLTDAQSKRILQDVIAPYFRRNDFYGGLNAGVAALTAILDQEHLPAPAGNQRADATQDEGSLADALVPLLFFIFLVVVS